MGNFIVRFGNRGSRISRIKSNSIVNAKKRFKKIHPKAKIDSTETLKSFDETKRIQKVFAERDRVRKFLKRKGVTSLQLGKGKILRL